MITAAEYTQLKAYARIEGLIFGILWVVVFACFISSLQDSGLEILASLGIIATPFVAYHRLCKFRDSILGGTISFRRGFAYMAFSFAYASLIIAGATYVYFNFLDNGYFLMTIQQQLAIPEVQTSFKQAGIDMKLIQQEMDILAQVRPIEIAFSFMSNGLVSGFFLALLLGLICRRRTAKI